MAHSWTADHHTAPRERDKEHIHTSARAQLIQTNRLSLPQQDDFIYFLNVVALDETNNYGYLHFSMQNIEMPYDLDCPSMWSHVVSQLCSLFINICVTSFTYRHYVMFRYLPVPTTPLQKKYTTSRITWGLRLIAFWAGDSVVDDMLFIVALIVCCENVFGPYFIMQITERFLVLQMEALLIVPWFSLQFMNVSFPGRTQ